MKKAVEFFDNMEVGYLLTALAGSIILAVCSVIGGDDPSIPTYGFYTILVSIGGLMISKCISALFALLYFSKESKK